jgi:replicative DNA helicase
MQANTHTQDSSEGIVLKNFCLSKDMRDKYLHRTTKSDFVFAGHGKIFTAICNKHQANEPITKATVTAAMPDDMAMRMMVAFCFDSKVEELTDVVFSQFKKSGSKNRLTQLRKYIEKKETEGADPAAVSEAVRNMLDRVDDGDNDMDYAYDMNQTADAAMEMLEEWRKTGNAYQFGIPEIDDDLFLSQLTGYVVIGGESGGGKTAAMLNIAKTNSNIGNHKTAIVSLEMSRQMLCYRMAMESPKLVGKKLTQANLNNPKTFDDIRFAIDYCRKFNIVIVEGVSNIFSIARIVRALALKRNVICAILDYLQMADTGDEKESDMIRVSTSSKVWKTLTIGDKKRGIPALRSAVALSQYTDSNQTGKIDKKEPKKMRWSRQIKMDSDLMLHLQDIEVPEDFRYDFKEYDSYIEIFCEKQRNGAAGWRHPVIFHRDSQTFSSPLLDKLRQTKGYKNTPAIPKEVKL